MTSELKWQAFDAEGRSCGRFGLRIAAMNWLEQARYPGLLKVCHLVTGETWERRRGSWFKTIPGQPRPSQPRKGRAA